MISAVSKQKDLGVDESFDPYSDAAVAEFLRQRQERILARRSRIGIKLADRNQENRREIEAGSSLELMMPDDDSTSAGGSAGKGSKRGSKGGSESESGQGKGKDGRRRHSKGGLDSGYDTKKSTVDPLDGQVEESRKQLEQIILDGEVLITNVRVASECREKLRHAKAKESEKERVDRLNAEATECQEMFETLKPNWDLKGEKTLPLDLFEKVKSQMQACEELLMKKQDLIDDLKMELEEADFEFDQSLEMYQKDVSLIGDRIDDNVDELQDAFRNELNLVEEYTCRNREAMLEEKHREWMDLMEDFQMMEENHLADRKNDSLNKFQQLNELYAYTKQECRAMRHKFEDDCRMLIQELEQIKYATQLNMEKLQYNLAIVRKRYKENVEMKNMMKRLLLKFNDRFSNKSKAFKDKMEGGKKEAKKILQDIAKLEDSLNHFGSKTLSLASSDWSKYMDLWAVSEEMMRDKLQRLLDSEKFIFETQLGIACPNPDLSFLQDRPEQVTKYLVKKSNLYAELLQNHETSEPVVSTSDKPPASELDTSTAEEFSFSCMSTEPKSIDACPAAKSPSLLILPSGSFEFVPGPDPDPLIQRRLMKHIAKAICNESGFMVEEELRRVLEPIVESERNLVNLDALLKALGINSVGEMQHLAHFLLKRCRVTKGIISRIGTEDSAHLTEMNVSLTGILGEGDDWDSGSMKTKTPSPNFTADDKTDSSLRFQECTYSADAEETQADPSGGTNACALIPELKEIEDHALSYTEFVHEPLHCSPKCCSPSTSIEQVIVAADDDDELEEELNDGHSVCSTCGGEPHDHKDCSFVSNVATVLSWVDPEDPPNRKGKRKGKDGEDSEEEDEDEDEEEIDFIEIPDVVIESMHSQQLLDQGQDLVGIAPSQSLHQISSIVEEETSAMEGETEAELISQQNFGEAQTHESIATALPEAAAVEATAAPEATVSPETTVAPEAATAPETAAAPTPAPSTTPGPPPASTAQALATSTTTAAAAKPEEHTSTLVQLHPKRISAETQVKDKDEEEEPTGEGESQSVVDEEFMPHPELGSPIRIYSPMELNIVPEALQEKSKEMGKETFEDDEESIPQTIMSRDTSSGGSDEFLFIDPEEVIEALTEFCNEHNAKLIVEEPTREELIDKKLQFFKYPRQSTVLDYWERPLRLLNTKSDDLWDTMQYCFEQFNESLRKRNEMVDEIIELNRRNYELSFLMKSHVLTATNRFSSAPPNRQPFTRGDTCFC